MGQLIEFPGESDRLARVKKSAITKGGNPEAGTEGKLLLFTGVRYERTSENNASAQVKLPKRLN